MLAARGCGLSGCVGSVLVWAAIERPGMCHVIQRVRSFWQRSGHFLALVKRTDSAYSRS
jgi:hypothetical protein